MTRNTPKTALAALTAAVLLIATPAARAAGPVSVKLNAATAGAGTVGAAVVGSATDTWNRYTGANSGGTVNLVDASNLPTGLTATYTATASYNGNTAQGATPDDNLFKRYAYNLTQTLSNANSVVIGGLTPGQSYDVYLYPGYDTRAGQTNVAAGNTRVTQFSVIGAVTTGPLYITNPGGSTTAMPTSPVSTYQSSFGAPADTSAAATGSTSNYGNYLLVSGVTPSDTNQITLQFAAYAHGTASEGDFAGFQIVAVPEPGTVGLFALGGSLAFLVRRRRA
jgi:hypothetical protein